MTRSWDSSISCEFDDAIMPARLVMSKGELGCATSHAVLWHACAARADDAPPLLVLEDDAMLYSNFTSRARKCIRALEAAFPPHERNSLLFLGAEVMRWRADNTAERVTAALPPPPPHSLAAAAAPAARAKRLRWPGKRAVEGFARAPPVGASRPPAAAARALCGVDGQSPPPPLKRGPVVVASRTAGPARPPHRLRVPPSSRLLLPRPPLPSSARALPPDVPPPRQPAVLPPNRANCRRRRPS